MDFTLTEEQELFRKTVRQWVDQNIPKSLANEIEQQEHEFPHQLWDMFTEAGFHGVGIDEQYGGQGGDIITQMILMRELARSLAGLAWVWGISSFSGAKSVGMFGNEEQKQRFLPKLARGEIKFAIAYTEPDGGTDVLGAMKTFATKDGDGWRITGQKIWSTAAHVADYLLLLARTERNPEKKSAGTTVFLVPRDQEGITTRQIPKIGMRAVGSCEVFLENAWCPDENVLGEVGRGFHQSLATLNNERIMLAALCCGIIDGALEEALDYIQKREAFGKKIGQFQAIQHFIADMRIMQTQAELMTFYAAWKQQQGLDCGLESNMAKIVASENAGRVADLALQMFGGMGYAYETNPQRYWRDARLYRIGPIANEMARNSIAEMMGLPRSF
ncbi:MAG: acyl-CoA dehydrogenase [Acidimicrobiia bacterium]|nr:MAG: acyl-CoA dehydrogenase [Acidimicrobiia bacterium]